MHHGPPPHTSFCLPPPLLPTLSPPPHIFSSHSPLSHILSHSLTSAPVTRVCWGATCTHSMLCGHGSFGRCHHQSRPTLDDQPFLYSYTLLCSQLIYVSMYVRMYVCMYACVHKSHKPHELLVSLLAVTCVTVVPTGVTNMCQLFSAAMGSVKACSFLFRSRSARFIMSHVCAVHNLTKVITSSNSCCMQHQCLLYVHLIMCTSHGLVLYGVYSTTYFIQLWCIHKFNMQCMGTVILQCTLYIILHCVQV